MWINKNRPDSGFNALSGLGELIAVSRTGANAIRQTINA